MLQVFVPARKEGDASQFRAGAAIVGTSKGAGYLLVTITGHLGKGKAKAVRTAAEIHHRAPLGCRRVVASGDLLAVAELDENGEMNFVSDEARQMFRAWAKYGKTSRKKESAAI